MLRASGIELYSEIIASELVYWNHQYIMSYTNITLNRYFRLLQTYQVLIKGSSYIYFQATAVTVFKVLRNDN